MPATSRWMIRSSLVWLVIGLALQVASPFGQHLPLPQVLAGLRPFELHALTLGWLTQLVFGVVYWMFPKASLESPRGSAGVAVATAVCLNAGLVLRGIGEGLASPLGWSMTAWILPLAGVLLWLAAVGFTVNTWPRLRAR